MSTFNTTKLAGNRTLVTGDTPEQKVILESALYDQAVARLAMRKVDEAYTAEVEQFFKPLTDAAEAAQAAVAEVNKPYTDEAFSIVLSKGTEGVANEPEERVSLDYAGAVLKLIDSGDTSRLMWVGSTIEILAQ